MSRRPRRFLKARALVVTEGEVTEQIYIELLMQELRSRAEAAVTVKRVGVGKDPAKVVDEARRRMALAEREGQPYDWCCCLVDVDDHVSLPVALVSAKNAGLGMIVSNPKFEIWLLWHVDDRRGHVTGVELDRRIARAGLLDGKHLRPTFPVGEHPRAAQRARQADPDLVPGRRGPNPSTAMPVLIDMIVGRAQ